MGERYLRKVFIDVISSGGSTRIDNLRIKFNIKKTSGGEPNKSEISIYNLSEKTRSLFETKGCKVALSAGHLGINPEGILLSNLFKTKNVDLIFKGDVVKFQHTKDGTDIITKLECGDGHVAFTSATLDKGYHPDTSLSVPFQDLASALGLAKGAQITIPDRKIGNGLTLSGPVRAHLDNLCKRYGLEWSIQNEALQIVDATGFTTDGVVLLSKDTGLVGSPTKTKDGVEITCLIEPALRPAKRINLDSMFIKGVFHARTVTHDGDSHQGTFLTKSECNR